MLPPMIEPRHRWVFPDPLHVSPEFRAAARERGIGTFAATVLARRGIADTVALAAFLGPAVAGLNDPRLLPDAGRLVARVTRARDRGERVMVFGDFDADGLTGLAQLVLAFRRLGLETQPYVPSRLEEGHGLSMAAVETAAATGTTLIVTVDTGSTSVAEVAAARDRGIDVMITDHHRLPDVLPAAVALVNPHRADFGLPGPGAVRERRGVHGRPPAAPASCWRPRPRRWSSPTSPRSAPCRTSSPILGENRAIARLGLEHHAHGAAARDRRAARPGRRRAGDRGPRDGRVRARAAPQRRGPGGGGARCRPPAARGRPSEEADRAGDDPGEGERHPTGPDADRDRGGTVGARPAGPGPGPGPACARRCPGLARRPGAGGRPADPRRRWTGRAGAARARPVAGRDHRARRGPAGRRDRSPRGRRHGPRRRPASLVPQ